MSIWSSAIYIYRLFYGWWARTFFIHKLRKTNKRTIYRHIYIYIYIYIHTRTHTPAPTKDSHLFHPTKHHSTKPSLHIKKHSTNADTSTLHSTNQTQLTNEKTDNGNILWYNPSFSKNVRTNIGHRFLALVDKQFPKDHKLRKIFDSNTIKTSYSCMNNSKQVIDSHNECILNSSRHIHTDNTNTKDTKTCNCRQKNTCPPNGKCLQSSLIYQATVTSKDNSTNQTYIGLTETDFKTRYRNHTASVQHTKHRHSTELSKHISTLK